MPSSQLMQSHQCLPGEADEEPRLTLTEQYTGLLLDQPSKGTQCTKVAKLVDAGPGPYVAQQTRFGDRDGDAPFGAIVCGVDQALRDRLEDKCMRPAFEIDVECRWGASIHAMGDALIFAAVELVAERADERDEVTLGTKSRRAPPGHVIDDPDTSDAGGGVDPGATGVVVQAHVAAHHRNLECPAGLADALDRL